MESELNIEQNKEYEVKVIKDSGIYINEVIGDQLLELYHLVLWNDHPEDENT